MGNNTNPKSLKIFFIKLVSIFIAIIIAINNLFPVPCLPNGFTENIAPISTIPTKNIGVDNIVCK